MPIDQYVVPQRETVGVIAESLEGMLSRVEAILAEPPLTEETLVEIMAITNNVAYVFLYLEAVNDTESVQRLTPWRDAFDQNPDLDDRVLGRLLEMRCDDPDVEESRLEYIAHLRRRKIHDSSVDEEIGGLLDGAKALLDSMWREQRRLLERITHGGEIERPAVALHQLMSRMESSATRSKLARAWAAQRDPFSDRIATVIDEMVSLRRRQAEREGFPSPLDRSLRRSKVTHREIADFLDRYLEEATRCQRRLAEEVRDVAGDVADPLVHFEYALQTSFRGSTTPMFVLDDCLQYICEVARSVFGLTFQRVNGTHPEIITMSVWRGGDEIGHINFDLWDAGRKTIAANHTTGIRNRTDWSGRVQRPVAYVSCRFQRDPQGVDLITFQNVHSLYHEFGHAVNHLLVRKRISYQSGLEYLPPERLEYLSMWFEKWVYHPEFVRRMSLTSEDREAVERCRRIKLVEYRRTYVERGVTAAVDFDVHRRAEGTVRESFDRLDDRFGIAGHCAFGDVPGYFTWPMYMAKPGANFSYLWGAASSCENFEPFARLGLDEIALKPELAAVFDVCFDFQLPTTVPDSGALFRFYESASLRREDGNR